MNRVKADLLLMLAALIWGLAFVAQKTAMESIGPFTFIGLRFVIASVVMLPFLLRENRKVQTVVTRHDKWMLIGLCASFCVGMTLQQFGVTHTSVTNAGFLTALYVMFVPIVSLLCFKKKPHFIVWIAAPLCLFGVWLLGDASLTRLTGGDLLVISCAFVFSFGFVILGHIASRLQRPMMISVLQSLSCVVFVLPLAFIFEHVTITAIMGALPALLYAGILSSAIAFTLQIIAQEHTPPADAAIICAGESLFAALGGAVLMHDRLSPIAWMGCGIIFAAILLVELYPLVRPRPQ